MKQEVMEKWTQALESGEYKRAKGVLKSKTGGFCCLGVLCELHSKETGQQWDHTSNSRFYFDERFNLPNVVKDWAGMDNGQTRDCSVMYTNKKGREFRSLVDINDETKKTFKDIAGIIKENWEKL